MLPLIANGVLGLVLRPVKEILLFSRVTLSRPARSMAAIWETMQQRWYGVHPLPRNCERVSP